MNGVVSDEFCQKPMVRQVPSRGAGPGAVGVTRTSYSRRSRSGFVADSLLEGTGFEPSVPRGKGRTLRVSVLFRSDFSVSGEPTGGDIERLVVSRRADGSNPVPSSAEPANYQFRSRQAAYAICAISLQAGRASSGFAKMCHKLAWFGVIGLTVIWSVALLSGCPNADRDGECRFGGRRVPCRAKAISAWTGHLCLNSAGRWSSRHLAEISDRDSILTISGVLVDCTARHRWQPRRNSGN